MLTVFSPLAVARRFSADSKMMRPTTTELRHLQKTASQALPLNAASNTLLEQPPSALSLEAQSSRVYSSRVRSNERIVKF